MQNSAADFDAIEREVDAQLVLLDPFADADAVARATAITQRLSRVSNDGEDGDTEVEAFVSHQPQYQRSIVAKKLQLYEKQLAIREKQIAKLQTQHAQALAAIKKLKDAVESQQREFGAAQDEWEEEKADLLRFRGGGNAGGAHGGASAMLFQIKMGASAAAMAARSRNQNDAETQRQRELRMQMLRGAVDVQDQLDEDSLASLVTATTSRSRLLWKRLRGFVARHLYPFAGDVRQIEARFGYSVASYFRFFRWIIMSFVAISIPSAVSLVLHLLVMKEVANYVTVDWTSFVGVAPAFLLFPRYHPLEGMLYSMLLLLFTVRKWIAEDRQLKALEAVDSGTKKLKFAKVVLNAWDFSVTTREQASDDKKSIAEQIKVTLQEDELSETLRRRTPKERYKLYTRRAVAFLIYLVIQAASWYLIIFVTTQSSEIQQYIALKASFLAPYASSIVPAIVTLINGILPTIISLLTSLEKWDDVGFAIKAMVTRLYLAKVLNVLIQLISYALLLDPYLFSGTASFFQVVTFDGPAVRRNVMLTFKPEIYSCRAEQVASGLLSLVVTDFTVGKVVAIAVPGAMWSAKKVAIVISEWRARRQARKYARVVPVGESDEQQTIPADPDPGESRPPSSAAKEALPRPASATDGQSLKGRTDAQTNLTALPTASASSNVAAVGASPALPLQPLLKKVEFQVPQKMVALLYSCTIALVAIPLAPSAALLALLLHVINFKFDKLVLMYFQKKPNSPWSAKDAGSFFIKFYFCTVSIFMVFAHFFLSNPHLPRDCALQDALLKMSSNDESEQLCLPGTYDATTERCTLDTTNSKSTYFASSANALASSKIECSQGYPKCICSASLACGPFVGVRDGYTPLLASALSVRAISAAYTVVASSAFVAWGIVLALAMGSLFLRNSLGVLDMVARAREHEVAISFAALRHKIKQLENRLRVHRMSGATTGQAEM